MATVSCQLSEDDFLCCICLQVFKDPVTLPCGHNICKHCLQQFWSKTVIYKCPSCRKVFNTRPEMMVNTLLAAMTAQFLQSQPKASSSSEDRAAKPGEIPCDVCKLPKLRAVKSCLVCLSSYCQSHLQPHLTLSGLKTHQLLEPQANLQKRLCLQHHKPLELFCKNDQLCLCVLCPYHKDHKDHEVVPLMELSQQQKLQLKKTELDIQEMVDMRQIKIQELRLSVDASNKNADREIADSVKVLKALKDSVERAQYNLVQEINWKKRATEDKAKGFILEMEREISVLQKRSNEIKKLSQCDDHLNLLQNLQKGSVPTTKDWTDVFISPPTYKGTVARALSQLEEEFNKTSKKVFETELERAKTFEVDVTLDSDTAHPQLIVSRNCKEVVQSNEKRNTLDNSKRFDGLFVLGKQSFSGSFYFEAAVSNKTEWTLGVAEESVHRKGFILLQPIKGFWTLGLRNNTYYVCDDLKNHLSTKCKPQKVGVFVDKEEGLVSFFDVDAAALIYSLTDKWHAEKLYPICSPGWYDRKNYAPLIVGVPSPSVRSPLKRALLRRVHSNKEYQV